VQPTISPNTAGIIVPFLKTLAASGTIPRTEANAAAVLLRGAAHKGGAAQPAAETLPQLLTLAQAAERLACSRRTVSRMICDKTLTARYLRPGHAKSLRVSAIEVESLTCGQAVAHA
jgi:excisionase family DNA binding protein